MATKTTVDIRYKRKVLQHFSASRHYRYSAALLYGGIRAVFRTSLSHNPCLSAAWRTRNSTRYSVVQYVCMFLTSHPYIRIIMYMTIVRSIRIYMYVRMRFGRSLERVRRWTLALLQLFVDHSFRCTLESASDSYCLEV